MSDNVYVIDTSSFIALRPYYEDVFISFWKELEKLINNQQLISPQKVLDDLKKQEGDSIYNWAMGHNAMFRTENEEQLAIFKEIVNKNKPWINPNSEKNQADPYVVALAESERRASKNRLVRKEIVVITEESQDPKRLKIPSVCTQYGIVSWNCYGFFQKEGWKF